MPTVIRAEPWDRDRRLADLGLDRERLIEVVKDMVAARAGCTINDAKSAPGYSAWNAGVKGLRLQYLRDEGWERETLNGIETIKCSARRIRISVASTTADTGLPHGTPRNRTRKGPAAGRIIDLNGQTELFPNVARGKPEESQDGFSIWYLCVFDDNLQVRAELSRPTEFEDEHFVAFSERIFILGHGEWDDVEFSSPDLDDGQDFDVPVTRKS